MEREGTPEVLPFVADLPTIHRFWERVTMVFGCISIAEPTKALMHSSEPVVAQMALSVVTG